MFSAACDVLVGTTIDTIAHVVGTVAIQCPRRGPKSFDLLFVSDWTEVLDEREREYRASFVRGEGLTRLV